MNPGVDDRLRYALAERDQCRGRIIALLRELGVLRLYQRPINRSCGASQVSEPRPQR
jgi:hypothetical protein